MRASMVLLFAPAAVSSLETPVVATSVTPVFAAENATCTSLGPDRRDPLSRRQNTGETNIP